MEAPTPLTKNIHAMFQPQEIVDGRVRDRGQARLIDVTQVILQQPLAVLRRLRDNDQSSDALVPYAQHMHNDLFRVELVRSMCAHLGVERPADITEEKLTQARRAWRAAQALEHINAMSLVRFGQPVAA